MKGNYDHLIGKEVRYEAHGYSFGALALVVAHIDPEVGITLTEKGDESGDAIACLVQPDIHKAKHNITWEDGERERITTYYNRDFENWIDAIQRGVFDQDWQKRKERFAKDAGYSDGGSNHTYTPNEMCAFR